MEHSSQFGICNKGVLNTLSNQANYHKLGSILNSPPSNVKCNMLIMRACKKDVMGPKVKGETVSYTHLTLPTKRIV